MHTIDGKKRGKGEKEVFDEMWDIPRLYVSACSNSVQLVPLHPIVTSILFHHYKELKECISEVKQLECKVKSSSKNKEELMIKKEEEKKGKKKPPPLKVLAMI